MPRLTVNEYSQGFSDEVVIEPNDFKGKTAVAETIVYKVPEGTVVTAVGIHTVTPFDGGSLTGVNIDVGPTGTPQGYIDAADIGGGGDTFEYSNGDLLNASNESVYDFIGSDGKINILVTPSGDGLANATEGEVKVKLSLVRLAD